MDYLTFFSLTEDPFRLTPDTAYFYPSQGHNEIISSLNYAIEQKEGFSLLVGEPGTGKTTLLRVLMDGWKGKAEVALIITPRLSPEEFLQSVLEDLNVTLPAASKNEMLKAFRDILVERSASGKRVLIVVDEAQNLPDDTLEELRLLSNLETEKEKLLQIILIGQMELKDRLEAQALRQLNQRITVRATLKPLTSSETWDYINYRLVRAGRGGTIFDEGSKKLIFQASGGIPRLINLIASRALMAAYVEGSTLVKKNHVLYARQHLAEGGEARRVLPPVPLYVASTAALVLLVAGAAYWYMPFPRKAPPPVADVQTATEPPKAAPVKNPVLQPTGKVLVVRADSANLRAGPSTESDIISWVSRDVVLRVIGEAAGQGGEQWYRVKISDGRECWIAGRTVDLLPPGSP